MTASSEPDALLARIEGRLAAARAALEGDGLADLGGLDDDMAALRALAADLPAGRANRLQPRLLALLEEFDRLADRLRAGLDRLGRDLGQTGKRRQAFSAYARGQGAAPKDRR